MYSSARTRPYHTQLPLKIHFPLHCDALCRNFPFPSIGLATTSTLLLSALTSCARLALAAVSAAKSALNFATSSLKSAMTPYKLAMSINCAPLLSFSSVALVGVRLACVMSLADDERAFASRRGGRGGSHGALGDAGERADGGDGGPPVSAESVSGVPLERGPPALRGGESSELGDGSEPTLSGERVIVADVGAELLCERAAAGGAGGRFCLAALPLSMAARCIARG